MTRKRSTSGETMVEALVALLIAALAVCLLVTAISAANHMNTSADQWRSSFNEQRNAAEVGAYASSDSSLSQTTGTVSISDDQGSSSQVDVVFYGGDSLSSYVPSDRVSQLSKSGGE
ncbi:MAG: hypothetical protein LKF61_01065 [Eggerthellaceae bacterium]|jgi:Tfp pilus assembly protein PilV|nr:hypothetical protein [Eggerthellaceae bacterium]MCH4220443.1 hypothetical protein [Eggerthellaceae bacterium]